MNNLTLPGVVLSLYQHIEMSNPKLAASLEPPALDLLESNTSHTLFLAPDDAWSSDVFANTTNDIIENHIFDGLWFLDDMLQMDGRSMTSINGKNWTISVINNTVSITSDVSFEGAQAGRGLRRRIQAVSSSSIGMLSGSTDNLARNGIIHKIDGLLASYETFVPESTAATTSPNPSISATVEVAFGMYNLEGLNSTALELRQYGLPIQRAFAAFAQKVVEDVASRRLASMKLRPRRLVVTLDPESPSINVVWDRDCDTNAVPPGAFCQGVYATFNLSLPETVDPNLTVSMYTKETNNATDSGVLQDTLDEIDPESPFTST